MIRKEKTGCPAERKGPPWRVRELTRRECRAYFHTGDDLSDVPWLMDADGHLVIREDQAVVVRKIFMLYLVGNSVLKIKRALENEEIPAPRGGTTWPKRTIEAILTNAKYAGTSYARTYCIADADSGRGIVATGDKGEQYILFGAIDNNPPIVPPKTFDKVQQMRMDRSNIEYDPDGTKKRKSTHYSSKQKPAGDV